ncbi:MarR family transcriptional regulator [Streptomyces sp. ME01-24h]|nr:MarR family transcriptional regulator [Streptomyces sp. ME19-03-3]MDX3215339.1 MarR family transcriptional regulator [Streptomyces sp. ME02-6991-2B]MDX3354195.1 MarR family transcriptional regulator [Streptomyces sp. ME01-24h]
MATQEQFAELADRLRAVPVVARELSRVCPPQCPPSSLGVLSVISRHGELRMGRLAELLEVDMSVTSRHVAQLAERGWIDRLPDPHDRRSRLLRLTPGGADMLRAAQDRVAEALAHHMRDWPDEDVTEFSRLLEQLHRDFAAGCRPRTPSTT